MYDIQLHSAKRDSEILPDKISHQVLFLRWETVQQRCSRVKRAEKITTVEKALTSCINLRKVSNVSARTVVAET